MTTTTGPDRDRQFGRSVGTVLVLLAGALFWRGRPVAAAVAGAIGVTLVVLGTLWPRTLKCPSAAWWAFAMALGWVNARVILTVIFVLVLTPLGLLWRLIGRDPMARRRATSPGWSRYPARYSDPQHFTRMF